METQQKELNELLAYFAQIQLPMVNIKVLGHVMALEPIAFLNACKRKFKGDEDYVLSMLRDYKTQTLGLPSESN